MTDRERALEKAREILSDFNAPVDTPEHEAWTRALLEAEARGNEWWPAGCRLSTVTLHGNTEFQGNPYEAKMQRAAELRAQMSEPQRRTGGEG